MSIIFLGVDPGINGAIAIGRCTDRGSDLRLEILQTFKIPTYKRQDRNRGQASIDTKLLNHMVRKWVDGHEGMAFLEDVHAMHRQGVVSMFRFGEAKGILQGILVANGCDCIPVSPRAWKKWFNLSSSDKKQSVSLANEFFPYLSVKDHNIAEAVLILYYGVHSLYKGQLQTV